MYIGSGVEVSIPDGVTSIGSSAFSDCRTLTKVTIPDSVTEIGESAFEGCTSLTSVTIPEGVTAIKLRAFSGCTSLTSVTIPESVTEIGYNAFSDCRSLLKVPIPDSTYAIDSYAFDNCTSLERVELPDSVTEIGESIFAGCQIKQLYLGAGITSVDKNWFLDLNYIYPKFFFPEYIVAATIPEGLSVIAAKARFVFKGSIADIDTKALKVKAIAEIIRKNPDAPVPDENEKTLINDYINKNITSFVNVLSSEEAFEYAKENGILTLKNINIILSSNPSNKLAKKLNSCSIETVSDVQSVQENEKK